MRAREGHLLALLDNVARPTPRDSRAPYPCAATTSTAAAVDHESRERRTPSRAAPSLPAAVLDTGKEGRPRETGTHEDLALEALLDVVEEPHLDASALLQVLEDDVLR